MIEAETRATEETTFTTETIYALLSAAIHKDVRHHGPPHGARRSARQGEGGAAQPGRGYFRQFMQLLGEH